MTSGLEGTGDKGYVTQDGLVAEIAVGDRGQAISYEGEDLEGNPLSLEDFRGKPVVVTVWGAWCADCRQEAPWVVGAADKLGDDVQFVGINTRDSSPAQAQAFERSFGVGFPSFYSPDGEAFLAFPGVLSPRTIPAFAVLDPAGRVAATVPGRLPSQQTLVDLAKGVLGETGDG